MNLELTNPFTTSFPEKHDSSIDVNALVARFNPSGLFAGHYIAVGQLDGVVVVLDFETKNIVRWLQGHVKAVTTVSWSHNSRYLLTASRDWNVIVWDLSSAAFSTVKGERRHTVRFDAPVTSAALHPVNSNILIATLHAQTQPVLVDLRTTSSGRWELEVPPEPVEEPDRPESNDGGVDGQGVAAGEGGEGQGEEEQEEEQVEEEDEEYHRRNREIATLARFNPKGDLVYVGTNRGNIHIWDVRTKEWLWTEYTGSVSAVKHLEFSPKGDAIIVNSNDRILRLFALSASPPPPPSPSPPSSPAPSNPGSPSTSSHPRPRDRRTSEPEIDRDLWPPRPDRIPYFETRHKFQDLVNRTPWNGCGFSSDGEYLFGGADNKGSHNIYIWDRDSGGLVKILEGPKDPLEDLDWHPLRPLIASTSTLGLIHTWVTPIVENWAAYAPGFEELDENREYEEKEDEFDIEDEQTLKRRQADQQDVPVDIMTCVSPSTRNQPRAGSIRTVSSRRNGQPLHEQGGGGQEPRTGDVTMANGGESHLDDVERRFEEWVSTDPDGDEDEAFCLAPELDELPAGGAGADENGHAHGVADGR
ncbi:hypothetical protein JCM10212_001481 [Sporobolomyces blumeae]